MLARQKSLLVGFGAPLRGVPRAAGPARRTAPRRSVPGPARCAAPFQDPVPASAPPSLASIQDGGAEGYESMMGSLDWGEQALWGDAAAAGDEDSLMLGARGGAGGLGC
jgi:hypothetical protein